MLPLGKYEETRRKRNKERQDEYKEFLRSQQQQVRNRAWKEHPEGDALSFGHSSESQKQKLEHERREEYKAFLKEKVDVSGLETVYCLILYCCLSFTFSWIISCLNASFAVLAIGIDVNLDALS